RLSVFASSGAGLRRGSLVDRSAYARLRANFTWSSLVFSEASNSFDPTLTFRPPRIEGSTRAVISGSLPSEARRADWMDFIWAALRAWAETTSAATTPVFFAYSEIGRAHV